MRPWRSIAALASPFLVLWSTGQFVELTAQDQAGGASVARTNQVVGASSGSTLWMFPGAASDTRNAAAGRVTPLGPLPTAIGAVTGYVVRVAYIIPTNRIAQANGESNLRNALVQYQSWYRDQMDRNGFGPRTFRFETEADGVTPKIYTITVAETDSSLRSDIWGKTIGAAATAGVPLWTSKQVWWLVPEAHLEAPDGAISGGAALGASFGSGDDPGVAMLGSDALARLKPSYLRNDNPYAGQIIAEIGPYALVQDFSFPWFEGTTFSSISSSVLGAGVHETSHAFGLPHDFRNDQNFNGNLMGNGLRGIRGAIYPERYPSDYTRASYGTALALSVSRYFNATGRFTDNTKPTLTIDTTGAISPVNGLLRISFTASDASGLYAAWLQLNGDLVSEMVLSGTNTTQTFATPYYTPGQSNRYTLSVFDTQGNKQTSDTFIVPSSGFNRAPHPFITISTPTAIVDQLTMFDASISTDPDGNSRSMLVEWDLNGDGVFDTSPTTNKTLAYKFTTTGDRLVRARLTDSLGAQSVSAPLAVRVEAPASVVAIAATDTSASETGTNTGKFTVFRIGPTNAALTVNYTVGGTATPGIDYSNLTGSVTIPVGQTNKTITIKPIDDSLVECPEIVVAKLTPSTNYVIGAPSDATVTIADNELPRVNVVAKDPNASEPGANRGVFSISRTGCTDKSLSVFYRVTGTASYGSDYTNKPTRAPSVVISAGRTNVVLTVYPKNDALVEVAETVVICLSNKPTYIVGPNRCATVTIADNDSVPSGKATELKVDSESVRERGGRASRASIPPPGGANWVTGVVTTWEVKLRGDDQGIAFLTFHEDHTLSGHGITRHSAGICGISGIWSYDSEGQVVGTFLVKIGDRTLIDGSLAANIVQGNKLVGCVVANAAKRGSGLLKLRGIAASDQPDLSGHWLAEVETIASVNAQRSTDDSQLSTEIYELTLAEEFPGVFRLEGEGAGTLTGAAIASSGNNVRAHMAAGSAPRCATGKASADGTTMLLRSTDASGSRIIIRARKD